MGVLGIDASNLLQGGGRTHLVELLGAIEPHEAGFDEIVVWGSSNTLEQIQSRPWLRKMCPSELNGPLQQRLFWQKFLLSNAVKNAGCSVLFVPGGMYLGDFHPVVVMNQNLLPFEITELFRFGLSWYSARLLLLRFSQARTHRNSDGTIFLSQYAKESVLKVTGPLSGKTRIIPHGISNRFFIEPRTQLSIDRYDQRNPFRLLYVSTIENYKHQDEVVKAVSYLRSKTNWPLHLDLVGRARPHAFAKLRKCLQEFDPVGEWAQYHGQIPYADVHAMYGRTELGIHASSCETFGLTLTESMASGLPIACSQSGPMPEMLGNAGTYFDPEKPISIARAIEQLIVSQCLRSKMAQDAFIRAKTFSWKTCATTTLEFLGCFKTNLRQRQRIASKIRREGAGRARADGAST